jgi:hypothetical protein
MAKPWSAVASSPEYQALAPAQQDAARSQYFDQVVASQLQPDQVSAARQQFDAQTGHKPAQPAAKPEAPDPNRVENAVRGFFGAPKVGAKPEYEKALSADSPFPDILPTSPTLIRDVGGALGQGARYLLRGAESNVPAIKSAIEAFKGAGTMPSMGQATGSRAAQAAESILAKYPGSAGVLARKGEEQATDIGRKVEGIADRLSTSATPSVAGRTIEKGLSGEGGFVDRFKQGQKVLYDKLDSFFRYSEGSSKSVKLPNTIKALNTLNPTIPGAPATSRFFQNAEMQRIKDAVMEDIGSMEAYGQRPNVAASNAMVKKAFRPADLKSMFDAFGGDNLPYDAVKKMRSLVGEKLEDSSLVSSVPRSKWKALYASLSEDLNQAARATGNPEAIRAMTRANRFSRAGYARIGDILDKVAKQDIPEKIFASAVNPADMKAGATKIGAIMRSLQPGERDVVKSAFVRRMGLAPAGQQGAEGGVFSSSTFLTNWNNMSPQAKDVMFGSADGELRRSMNSVAKTAERIKQGAKVFENPSGSGPAIAATGLISGAGTAALTGNLGVAGAMLGTAAGANLTARLMTNPKFVSWLAKTASARSPELARQSFLMLGKAMQGQPDHVKEDASKYAHSAAMAISGGGQ